MAVSFDGFFLSRELSARIPAVKFNEVSMSNVTPDHLLIDKGDANGTIIANKDNLGVDSTTGWNEETEVNMSFNGTLEGGRISDFDINVNGVVVRRTSNRTNFKEWEDVVVFPVGEEEIKSGFERKYDDIFVESGVLYKYAVQPVSGANRGPMTRPEETIMDYEHSWLIGEDQKQLMFAYNPQITAFNTIVKDAVVETIGGKYPFVVRNANTYYKQFQFSATITHFIDIEHTFMTDNNMFLVPGAKEDINISSSELYKTFYENKGINPDDNYILEREFRTKMSAFLYDGKPKVFKSDTEGLILVRISNVSLTPKRELGRTIYDMSCTMTEIGEVSFDTLINYKLKEGVKLNEL